MYQLFYSVFSYVGREKKGVLLCINNVINGCGDTNYRPDYPAFALSDRRCKKNIVGLCFFRKPEKDEYVFRQADNINDDGEYGDVPREEQNYV